MKILSIDIGIKNLAYIILENENLKKNISENKDKLFQIEDWNIINLCEKKHLCNECNKDAKFQKNNIYYCKNHTKNKNFKLPTFNIFKLEKLNLNDLNLIIQEYSILIDKNLKKKEIIEKIKEYSDIYLFEYIETLNANNFNLIELGINLNIQFKNLLLNIDLFSIDKIILENQISPIASRMKTLQGMIAQFFIDNNYYNIEFISSINKLKLFKENKKTSYKERKNLSIQYTNTFLQNNKLINEYRFFINNQKKDDLADCLLQGIYYLNNIN